MGGPWRERGFDAAVLRTPRPPKAPRAQVMSRPGDEERLGRLVLVYIMAVLTSFGLMVAVLQQGW